MLSNVGKLSNPTVSNDDFLKQLSASNTEKTGKGENIGELLNKMTTGSASGEMAKTKGKANPAVVRELFKKMIS